MTNSADEGQYFFSDPKNAAKAGHLGGKARWAKYRREQRQAKKEAAQAAFAPAGNGNGNGSSSTYVKDPMYLSYGLPVEEVPSPAKTARQRLYEFVRENRGKWVPVYTREESHAKSLQMIAAGNGFQTAVRGKTLYLRRK